MMENIKIKKLDHNLPDDPVNPNHYKTEMGFEAIDVIEAFLTGEEARGYRVGQAIAYLLRSGRKGQQELDIRKALWYLNRELNQL